MMPIKKIDGAAIEAAVRGRRTRMAKRPVRRPS
jgi:hypothetical protein